MNDHWSHAYRLHEDNIKQSMPHSVRVCHQRATQLDNGGLPAEFADPSHRFDERVGLGDRVLC